YALAAQRRAHEQVLEIQAAAAEEGREVVEEQREARRLVVPFGDHHFRIRALAEKAFFQLGFGGDHLVGELLVLGELAYERKDQGQVVSCCRSQIDHVSTRIASGRCPRSRKESR